MTFEEIKPLFRQMSPMELTRTANHLIEYATDEAMLGCRRWDLLNGTEQHM